jgi:hypothetical protein
VSCTAALERSDLPANAELIMEFGSPGGAECQVSFRDASPAVLARYGLRSVCPAEASLILVFTPHADGLRLDEEKTEGIDNAGCLEAA